MKSELIIFILFILWKAVLLQWQALVNMVMNPEFHERQEIP